MKRIILIFLLFNIVYPFYSQETFPVNGTTNPNHITYAFTNAQIVVDAETTIDNGTLLIKDGLITAVGTRLFIPKDAVIIDLNGKYIYPSFIDAYTNYGMPEVKKGPRPQGPQMESNAKGAFGWNQAIKADVEAFMNFSYNDKAAEEMRKLGFGTVLTFQNDGIVRGSGAVVALSGEKENKSILNHKAAALYSFDKGSSTQDYPSSLMGSIALLRQTYLDADWYKNDKTKTEFNISLEAFNKLQELPQIFETTDKLNALRADKIGDEFKIKYIIKGAGNEYQRIEDIKNTNCKFILPLNFPKPYDVEDPIDARNVTLTEMKHWELAPVNLYAFEKYFIPFAITTDGLKDKNDFWKNMRIAIANGLSEKQALKSLTTVPAQMLNVSDKVGAIKPGMIANFIITSTKVFDEKNIIYENWVQGNRYKINDFNTIDIRGTYDINYGPEATTKKLKIEGEPNKYKGTLTIDTVKSPVNVQLINNQITYSFEVKKELVRLSGVVDPATLKMSGKGQLSNGEWVDWKAVFVSKNEEKVKKDSAKTNDEVLGEIIYPFTAYGKPKENLDLKDKAVKDFKTRYDAILIENVTIWTNEQDGILKNRDIYITEGKIVRIADDIEAPKLAFAKVIDGTGKHLTAGIIDEHSHIAASAGVNEGAQASSAEVRIGDIINSEDVNIYRQLSGGVTCAQILHGSANPIGGQSALIKLRWGKNPEELKFEKADGFIKFALGENVKQSNWGELNTIRFPQTRMGVEQVYYDYFTRAKEYDKKQKAFSLISDKEKTKMAVPRRDLELEALAEIVNKKRFITCHSYVQSEINMLMKVGDSIGFKVNTFTHILEGYKVADKMKTHQAGASTFSDWWAYKVEVMDAIPYNAAILTKMGVVTAINSDDAEMARRLNQEAAKAVKYGGLSEEEALKLVTLNPAKLLHIEDKVGSVKVGKQADLVLWSDNPLSVYAKAEKTIIDGLIYYDIEEDTKLRSEIQKERARIIQKMIKAKKDGSATQKPNGRKPHLYECDSIEEDYMSEE